MALRVLGAFPQQVARFAIARFESVSGLDPRLLYGLDLEALPARRVFDYATLKGRFPAISLGAALGGASASLALALGGPFLPQAFVTTLKGGSPSGDPQVYYQRSARLALQLAAQNPNFMTIQHYDPVHDEWMTRFVNHLRFKLLDLPQVYRRFICDHLEPGGAIVYLDCQARWLRYRVGERSVFQVGGWGAISAPEFLEGSPRLQEFCRKIGLQHCNWQLDGFPLEEGAESEWGCEPGLGEALERFCQENGFRFVPLRLPEPHDYSRLAFHAIRDLLRQEGRQPAGVLVEMFSQFDPYAVFQSGLLPLWLVFNTEDSRAFLESMRPHFPPDQPVFFSPLATFTLTPDIVPFPAWGETLAGLDWRNVGARASHYPADARALIEWSQPLRLWAAQHANPIHTVLPAEQLHAIADEHF